MSDPERFRRIDALFAAALERPPTEREAFLDGLAGTEAGLRPDLQRLLAADVDAGPFLERPAAVPLEIGAPKPPPWIRLGPYRLLREIGGGGMGTVFLAHRDDEHYEREVAVKVLRLGLESADAVHRFVAERQILARLEHPGIARLYDGGSTDDGRPFLVMELVDGLPLDDYCDRHELGIDDRLRLFLRVCEAVQHAHQNLLVHRDLKPANILVTGEGEPKLLDFGIAKQLAPESGDLTRTGSRLMTPGYASPEQIRRGPITTASDVYSLGVVLYELLTGRRPYRAAGRLPHEIERAICEEEPERPSQAVLAGGGAASSPDAREDPESPEAIARARGTRPQALARKLRGDLDTIVAAALRKEPARRYGSVAELAADIERHLAYRPVAARPDTLLYRTRKLLRRRRRTALAVAAALVATLGFVLGLVEQGRRLARERDKAQQSLSFLIDTFREADPYQRRGPQLTAEEVLAQGAARVSRELAGKPDVQAALMDAIGQVQQGLGRTDAAVGLLAKAVVLRRAKAGEAPLELAASLEHLADARYERSEVAASETLLREAVELRRAAGGDPLALARALNQLGVSVATRSRSGEPEILHGEALGIAREEEGAEGPTVAATLILLARLAADRGDYARAERLYRRGLALETKTLDPGDPVALRNRSDLAAILLDAGKPREARELLLECIALQRRIVGDEHPDLIYSLTNLGLARQHLDDLAGAEAAYREALALPRRSSGDLDLLRATTLSNLAGTLQARKRDAVSLPLLREALELRRRSLGDRHPLVGQVLLQFARAERAQGHTARGLELAREALAIVEGSEGLEHPHTAVVLREIGRNYMEQKDDRAAEPYLRRVLAIRRKSFPADHPDVAIAELTLAPCLLRLGQVAEGETLLRHGRAALARGSGPDDPLVRQADAHLAELARKRAPVR